MNSDEVDVDTDDEERSQILELLDPLDMLKVHEYLLHKFRTKKVNSKGKEVKRTQVPQHFATLLITHTPNPFEIMVRIVKEVRYPDFERFLVKSLAVVLKRILSLNDAYLATLEYRYYTNWDGFRRKMNEVRDDMYQTIKTLVLDEQQSIWLCHWILSAEFNMNVTRETVDSITESQTKWLLLRLLKHKAHNELCFIISKYCLQDLIHFESLVNDLVSNNDVQNLGILTSKPDQLERALEYLEAETYTVLVDKSRNNRKTFIQNIPSVVKKLSEANWTYKYPCIYVASLHGQVKFIVRSIREALETEENLNYDHDRIAESFVDRLAYLIWELPLEAKSNGRKVEPRDLLLRYCVEKLADMKRLGLVLEASVNSFSLPDAQKVYCLENDPKYYTCTWPIVWIDSVEKLEELESMSSSTSIIGIDGEWTHSPLSTLQISCYSATKKCNFIVDCLNLDAIALESVLNQFDCVWVGFDLSQDIPKIDQYCGFRIPKLVDLKDDRKGSLADLVEQELHLKLDKRPRMSFWERRPLHYFQLVYAATDSQVLIELYLALKSRNVVH
jgi:hypothetical protein